MHTAVAVFNDNQKFSDITVNSELKAVVRDIKKQLDTAFGGIVQDFSDKGVSVVMPTYAPAQGRLLSEFNRLGGTAYIAGGKKNAPAFKNVTQYGMDFDTAAYINVFPEGMSKKIVGRLPDAVLQNQKVAIFAYIPPSESWAQHINNRGLNTQIVARNEQNTRVFFENKGNLMHVLREAGLADYVIPTEVVKPQDSEKKLRAMYHRLKGGNGKVVVQSCVENYEPTRFFSTEQDFVDGLSAVKMPFKVVRFVEGNEGNLSFFVANTIPAKEGFGVAKCNLPEGVDYGKPESLSLIKKHAEQNGIAEDKVFSVTGRATLKVVGDSLLANEEGVGVGNNIGHVYNGPVSRQIAEVGEKLGHLMGTCGKVGLAGADLIIEKNGKVWINEINDRQQGPTDQMSADAESASVPGLTRMSWFAHYADFSKPENVALLDTLRRHKDTIHQQYATGEGSFYIKVLATHHASHDGKVKAMRDLPEGIYTVAKKNGRWTWEHCPEGSLKPIDLSTGVMKVKITSGSLKKGDTPSSDAEMFRVTGIASGDNSPFVIHNGVSCVNPKWRPIIEQLYMDCFGEGYMQKNPLYVPPQNQTQIKAISGVANRMTNFPLFAKPA